MNTENSSSNPSDTETQRMPEQPASGAAPTQEAPTRKGGRVALITAGAIVALLAVGGGAYAIGANVADDDDDRQSSQNASDRDDLNDDGRDDADDDRDDANDDTSGSGSQSGSADAPSASAADLRSAAEKAIAEAKGKGATSIDVERGGYEVAVLLSDGSEPDVFVKSDGTVTVGLDDDRDDRPEPLLDLAAIPGISEAALKATTSAAGADGTIDSISTSDDPGVAYEVSIRLADGRDADVDLDAKLAVVSVDVDDN